MTSPPVAVTLLRTAIVVAALLTACRGAIAPGPEAPSPIGKVERIPATRSARGPTPTPAPLPSTTPPAPTPGSPATPVGTRVPWSEGRSVVVDRITAGDADDVVAVYSGGSPHRATVLVGPGTRLRHIDGHPLAFDEVRIGDLLHIVGEPLGTDPPGIRAGWILVVPWRPPQDAGATTEGSRGPAHTIVAVVAGYDRLPDVGFDELRLEPPHDGWIVQIVPGIPVEGLGGEPVPLSDIRPGDRIAVAGGSPAGATGDGDPLYARMILLLDR